MISKQHGMTGKKNAQKGTTCRTARIAVRVEPWVLCRIQKAAALHIMTVSQYVYSVLT